MKETPKEETPKENVLDNKTRTISINIQGQNFFLSCRPEKQDLVLAAGRRIDAEMKLAQGVAGRGLERIAITAAINLAIKLEQLEKSVNQGKSLPVEEIHRSIKKINSHIEEHLYNTSKYLKSE